MLKLLTEEIKELSTWEEAELWLKAHGWGIGLVEEQKLLWNEFKKSGTDSAELAFDTVTGSMSIVAPVAAEPVVAAKSATPVKAGK